MKRLLFFTAAMLIAALTTVRAEKRPLTIDDVMDWQRITHRALTDDGQYSLIVHEPWRGDGDKTAKVKDYPGDATALLFDDKGQQIDTFFPINGFTFTRSSKYLVVTTHENEADRHKRELKEQNGSAEKSKKDKVVQLDTLLLYNLASRTAERIDSVRSHKVAGEADWLAYQLRAKDSTLTVRLIGDSAIARRFEHVDSYGFSKKGQTLYFTTVLSGKPDTTRLYLLPLPGTTPSKKKGAAMIAIPEPILVKEGIGQKPEGITLSEDGRQMAFHWGTTDKKQPQGTGRALWLADTRGEVRLLSDSVNTAFPQGFVLSPNGKLSFSKDGSRLYFGTAPAPRQADTLTLKRDRPDVQIWSWDEPVQYTVQSYQKDRESKRTYRAVCHLADGRIVQLADSLYPDIASNHDGTGRYALLSDSRPYSLSSMWEGMTRRDYTIVDIETGERRLCSQADYTTYRISPLGHYAYGYNETDSCWYTIELATAERRRITTPQTFACWDEEDDHPNYPECYGAAGWLSGDAALLLYDRYDIWSIPAQGGAPTRLTLDGREQRRQYRLLRLDNEKASDGLNPKDVQMLRTFDETTKGSGYYSTTFQRPAKPRNLYSGNFMLSSLPTKAKDAPVILWAKSTFEHFPDVHRTDLNPKNLAFRQTTRLTNLEQQQEPFNWGTAELIRWTSYKGIALEGLLFKPADFDPSRKYPLIVYYYERNSETLYDYRMPAPQRSICDFHTFTSDGYLIFVPDIRYTDGHPGESAYDCILSGLDKVESLGFVDKAHIGTCGHSWGGYQSAYLATRTDRFAAIESGAPVVNMFSAYGGIRWGSGLARSFQYEHTQSRLGTTMWKHPDIYAENSSLLHFDKVTTPILIMHNDQDGHVPWQQGIEMFVALKRLGKTAWLLNYTGEPHWPVRMANRKDWCIRMKQFFDHYLKDAPAPRWMSDGIPAVDAAYELGY